MMVLGFADYRDSARRLATQLGMAYAEVSIHRFPDGESRVALPPSLPERVIFCQSLHHPNEKLVELLLAAKTARRLGAKHLTLVAPYLCYMRQDMAFNAGEAISQTIVGAWLADGFDAVVTVDPHLHRIDRLEQAVPAQRAVTLSAATQMGDYVRENAPGALLLGPDQESAQWVKVAAESAQSDYAVCQKVRHGDHDTSIALPSIDVTGRHIVLIDDIASSGGTLISAARLCLAKGARRVDAVVVHALFGENVQHKLTAAGISNVTSTDSVPHISNQIPLAALLASAF